MRIPVVLPASPSYKRHAVCPHCSAEFELEVAATKPREGSVGFASGPVGEVPRARRTGQRRPSSRGAP